MSMSMTYIQLIQQFPALTRFPHASFLTYQILVHLKTGVSNKRNKRHLATTLTLRAAYSANHKRAWRCKCE